MDKDDMKVTNGSSPMSPSAGIKENDIASVTLMTDDALRPSIRDLDKLFDTSDSENSDADTAVVSIPHLLI